MIIHNGSKGFTILTSAELKLGCYCCVEWSCALFSSNGVLVLRHISSRVKFFIT